MALVRFSQGDALTGAFNSSGRRCCFIVFDRNFRLQAARCGSSNTVTTGEVEVYLTIAKPSVLGDNQGGRKVGYALENDTINAQAAFWVVRELDLGSDDGIDVSRGDIGFLTMSSTNSADRFDNPFLVVEGDDRKQR